MGVMALGILPWVSPADVFRCRFLLGHPIVPLGAFLEENEFEGGFTAAVVLWRWRGS